VHLTAGRITHITGGRHHRSSAGFICPKGAHAHGLHCYVDRVQTPLKRTNARGGGRWRRVGWDQALDEIAAKHVGMELEESEQHAVDAAADKIGQGTEAHKIGD
jgi:anaerobic selenocysteine-containing dehydrogenase